MKFIETELAGAYIIEPELLADERGFFARTWCCRELEKRELNPRLVQCSISFNHRKGTLRGLHYQAPPHEEDKLVRCTRGAIFDVIVDIRPNSPSFRRHVAVALTAENRRALYVPRGFAHGFQTLEAGTEVFYQMSEFYEPGSARGLRWNDPALAIQWPEDERIISKRDRSFPFISLVISH